MKYLIFALLTSTAQAECVCTQICVLKQILKKNASPAAVPPEMLAPVILKLSERYEVDPVLIAKLVLVESSGDMFAYNAKSQDHGLLQINTKTAKAMNVGLACLYDWPCNLETGIRLLSTYDRVCRYNVGTGKLKDKLLRKCVAYEAKIAAIN